MARFVVRKKKRTLRRRRALSVLFFVAVSLWFCKQVFLKNYQYDLMLKQQELQQQIAEAKEEQTTLSIEVQSLQSYNRLVSVSDLKSVMINNQAIMLGGDANDATAE